MINEFKIVGFISEYFEGEQEIELDEEYEQFLNERERVYQELTWDFDAFVSNHSTIREYGLENKILSDLTWMIEHLMSKQQLKELKTSQFYLKFGHERPIYLALLNRYC